MNRLANGVFVALVSSACAAIGDPGGSPDGLPHGGTGQFRLLDSDESGVFGPPPGRAMVIQDDAIESAHALEGHVFYATAPLLDEPPMLPVDHPPAEIFWPAFGGRRVHRGTSREEGVGAFDAGGPVLEASAAWEGGEVFDPWMVRDGDTYRLYYAAAGGIGAAEASSVEGPFASVTASPIVEDARRPSVVRGPGEAWWMYYETSAGIIEAARSDDGVAFTPMGPIVLNGEDEGAGTERRVASPGAVRVETRAGRVLVRLYFESVRDGVLEGRQAHLFYVAGSEDGTTFERHPRPVMEQTDIRFPSPRLVNDRVTLLYGNLPHFGGPFQTRALVVAVGPAGHRFDSPAQE